MQTNSKNQMFVVIFSVILAFLVIFGLKEVKNRLTKGSDTKDTETTTVLSQTKPVAEPTTKQETTKPIIITNNPKDKREKSTLIFAGNMNVTETLFINSMKDEIITKESKDFFRSGDLSFLNLRTGFSAMTDRTTDSDTGNFAEIAYEDIFINMGITGVALANNHIMDYGNGTITSTTSLLKRKDIVYAGAGNNFTDASTPLIKNIGGRKIGIVNVSKIIPDDNWIATNKSDENNSRPGIHYYDNNDDIKSAVESCKLQCDIVIAYINCGDEDLEKTDASQQLVAHDVIDAGANLVIECNTNKILPVEYYNGVPIFYSLGTMLSEAEPDTALALIVSVDEKDALSFRLKAFTSGNSSLTALDETKASKIFNELNKASKDTFATITEDGAVLKIQ